MKKGLARKIIITISIFFFLIIALFIYDIIVYEDIVNRHMIWDSHVTITYQDKTIITGDEGMDIYYAAKLSISNRSLFFGEVHTENSITISIPDCATLTIYPDNEKSVILSFHKKNGIKRYYKLSNYDGFKEYVDTFYAMAENPKFKIEELKK